MNYEQAKDFLFNSLPMYQRIGKAAYKNNLDNSFYLDKLLNFPHRKFQTVHVAGTNGKGSVSHLLANILQKAGYKTGLYTSPHVFDYRERIKINGQPITEKAVTDFVNKYMSDFQDIKPSFFEITVAIAFDYFAKEGVDIAIIETGLGGRLDSTNIITPNLSIITNIGFDHTQFLGDTLKQIAAEKAGIIKDTIPVVIGEKNSQTSEVFQKIAHERKADLIFAEEIYSSDYSMITLDYKQSFNIYKHGELFYKNLTTDLLGMYQSKNMITTLAGIDVLNERTKFKITRKNSYDGVKNIIEDTGFYARWQVLKHNPLIVCDMGHNISALKALLYQFNSLAFENMYVVLGLSNDKDIELIMSILPINAYYFFTQAAIERAMPAQKLMKKALELGIEGEIAHKVGDAVAKATRKAGKNDFVFIGGSVFIVSEALNNISPS